MARSRSRLILLVSAVSAILLGLLWHDPVVAKPRLLSPEIRLPVNFTPNPRYFPGQSGGSLRVTNIFPQMITPTGPCLGYISATPNHVLTLDGFFEDLAVLVDSQTDTTLIVQGPGGIWCNDDADGHNPAIEGEWQAGSYRIWVGSYNPGRITPYQLTIRNGPQASTRT